MKVLVAVKRVLDYNIQVRVRPDGTGVDLSNVRMSMNPFDEIAVEEALRLREAGRASEVIVVSAGTGDSMETIRNALAMGADRGILASSELPLSPLAVAGLLAGICREEEPGLVILGKQAIDDDCNQTGQMLAALLSWPQATAISELRIDGERARVTCETDDGTACFDLVLPAVVTTDLRLNEPRYASLPNIMKAKRKPVDVRMAADAGVDLSPGLDEVRFSEPAGRRTGRRVADVPELLKALREEAGILLRGRAGTGAGE